MKRRGCCYFFFARLRPKLSFLRSSLATVHKHLTNLEEKGFIKRAWNRSRSVELVPTRLGSRALELPLLGYVAAGSPIEAVVGSETIAMAATTYIGLAVTSHLDGTINSSTFDNVSAAP